MCYTIIFIEKKKIDNKMNDKKKYVPHLSTPSYIYIILMGYRAMCIFKNLLYSFVFVNFFNVTITHFIDYTYL